MLKDDKGYILLTVLVIGIIFAILATGLFNLSLNEKSISNVNLGKEQAYYYAEAGLELAVYALEKDPQKFLRQNLTLDEFSNLPVGNGKIEQVTSQISSVSGSVYTILLESKGVAANGAKKTVQAKVAVSLGTAQNLNLNNFTLFLNNNTPNLNFNKKAEVSGNLVVPGEIVLEADDIAGAVYGQNVTVLRGQGNSSITITKIYYTNSVNTNGLNIPTEKIANLFSTLNLNFDDSYLRSLPEVYILNNNKFSLSPSYSGKIIYLIPPNPKEVVEIDNNSSYQYNGNYLIISPNTIEIESSYSRANNNSTLTIISINGDIELEKKIDITANLIALNGSLEYHDNSGKATVTGVVLVNNINKKENNNNVKAKLIYDPYNNLTNILKPFLNKNSEIKILEWKELYSVY
ncbi:hypothetical protein ciss_18720 [Carboxydothermus islandicus]|uniref:Type 4 fimbrial biogenesis protein PilX N-terminal domain-containing protein n=1 Tax=Carboxydothermus islandicus TaxID=661089 RepID=A0A1L8D444_9THEO|nr:hypothetical protein [Carboxydothermus islandicus]GAV25939.1 hypothetical protein ciss_18720 [Carboxydothermus islandicus]